MHKTLKQIYRLMHQVSNYICSAISAISFGLVLLCTLTVLLQVINRYVIVRYTNYSATFTDELARFLLIWISYTAVALCLREGSMAQVDIIYSRLNKKGRVAMFLFTRVVMGFVLYVIIRHGFWFTAKKGSYHSAMLNIPGNILYATVPIGGVLLAYEWLTELFGVLSGEVEPFTPQDTRGFPEHLDESDEDIEKLEAFAKEVGNRLGRETKNEPASVGEMIEEVNNQ